MSLPGLRAVPDESGTIADTEVVIVGGGIAGISTALFLARAGTPVLVCEKGVVAGEQSSRNWGWIGRQKRAPAEMALCAASLGIWDEVNALSGRQTGFRRTGMLHVCRTEADVVLQERWLEAVKAEDVDSRMIGRGEVDALVGPGRHPWTAGLYTPTDARADPRRATAAIAEAARHAGAAILQHCAVRALDLQAGRVVGVVTERGRIACRSVLVAGGAWSRRLLRHLGVTLPQLKIRSSNQRVTLASGITASLWGDGFTLTTAGDGTATVAAGEAAVHDLGPDSFRFLRDFLPILRASWRDLRVRVGRDGGFDLADLGRPSGDRISPFERVRVLDPAWDAAQLDGALAALRRDLPDAGPVRVLDRWAGCIEVVPDLLPVISGIETVPGLFVASFSGHGFGLGPVAGKLLAALIRGEPPPVDPRPFRFARFSEQPRPSPAAGW